MKAIIKSDIKELNTEIELDDLQPKYLYDKFDELFSQKRYKGHDLLLRIRDKENKKQYIWSTQLSPNRTYFLGYC